MMQEEYNARDKTSNNARKRRQQSRKFKAVSVCEVWDDVEAVVAGSRGQRPRALGRRSTDDVARCVAVYVARMCLCVAAAPTMPRQGNPHILVHLAKVWPLFATVKFRPKLTVERIVLKRLTCAAATAAYC